MDRIRLNIDMLLGMFKFNSFYVSTTLPSDVSFSSREDGGVRENEERAQHLRHGLRELTTAAFDLTDLSVQSDYGFSPGPAYLTEAVEIFLWLH